LDRLWENGPLWFLLHLTEFGRLDFGYTMDPETGGPDALFFTSPDGSWCEVSPVCGHSGQRDVWEAGPRHLWAKIEAISQVWEEEGQPGWDRFGLTVTRDEQVVWLDDPQGPHRWVLPRLT
jgi:hypothetical protein